MVEKYTPAVTSDITGVAHRIGWLERLYAHIAAQPGVLMWTGEQILDWYLAQRG